MIVENFKINKKVTINDLYNVKTNDYISCIDVKDIYESVKYEILGYNTYLVGEIINKCGHHHIVSFKACPNKEYYIKLILQKQNNNQVIYFGMHIVKENGAENININIVKNKEKDEDEEIDFSNKKQEDITSKLLCESDFMGNSGNPIEDYLQFQQIFLNGIDSEDTTEDDDEKDAGEDEDEDCDYNKDKTSNEENLAARQWVCCFGTTNENRKDTTCLLPGVCCSESGSIQNACLLPGVCCPESGSIQNNCQNIDDSNSSNNYDDNDGVID